MLKFRNDLFRSEMNQAIRLSSRDLQQKLAGERLYGFSLCLESLGFFVGAYGNSEEGLDRVVDVYRKKGYYTAKKGDLTSHLRASLRWNCEDGWLALDDPYYTNSNELLRASYDSDPDQFYDRGCTRLVYLECLAALADCDRDGLFGRGRDRESLTLTMYLGDQSDQEWLGWAIQVNPDEVYNRFQAELAAGNAAHEQLIYTSPKRR